MLLTTFIGNYGLIVGLQFNVMATGFQKSGAFLSTFAMFEKIDITISLKNMFYNYEMVVVDVFSLVLCKNKELSMFTWGFSLIEIFLHFLRSLFSSQS